MLLELTKAEFKTSHLIDLPIRLSELQFDESLVFLARCTLIYHSAKDNLSYLGD